MEREYRRVLARTPEGRVLVLRISVANMLLPTLTTWGRPVGKSRTQLQREVLSLRVRSLVMSFVGTMVLNAEL